MDPLHLDTIGDVMRAARAAAQAQARALRPDTPVAVPREASLTWSTDLACAYCGAPLEPTITNHFTEAAAGATWDTVTHAICTNDRCAHPFDIHMRLRPRAPRRPHVIHHRNRAAAGAALIDTITGTSE